jgi:hypothetical protein
VLHSLCKQRIFKSSRCYGKAHANFHLFLIKGKENSWTCRSLFKGRKGFCRFLCRVVCINSVFMRKTNGQFISKNFKSIEKLNVTSNVNRNEFMNLENTSQGRKTTRINKLFRFTQKKFRTRIFFAYVHQTLPFVVIFFSETRVKFNRQI